MIKNQTFSVCIFCFLGIIYGMKNILLAGGGTAGHIIPHIALMPILEKNYDNVYYVGSGKDIEKQLMNDTCAVTFTVDAPAFIRSFSPRNLTIPIKLFKAIKQCEKIIKQTKPNVIFSKGGYCALPVCIAGFNLGVPVICHESDLTLGLANKITRFKAKALLTTFKETAQKYENGVFVGPPVRQEFFNKSKSECRKLLGITDQKPIVLITGGSQGSKVINDALSKNLPAILKKFNVIHLHGKNNKPLNSAINGYYPFAFADMPTVMSACDICVSRGGSNTLFELLSTNTPTLIIPLKKGSRGDQIKNAKYFCDKGALLCADEDELDKKLPELINELYSKRFLLKRNTSNLRLKEGLKHTAEILLKYSK